MTLSLVDMIEKLDALAAELTSAPRATETTTPRTARVDLLIQAAQGLRRLWAMEADQNDVQGGLGAWRPIRAEYAAELQRALSLVADRVTGSTNFNGEVVQLCRIVDLAWAQIARFSEPLAPSQNEAPEAAAFTATVGAHVTSIQPSPAAADVKVTFYPLQSRSGGWRPTHVHVDGGEYRFLRHIDGRVDQHEPWRAGVLYEDSDGRMWWTGNDRWFDRFTAR